MYDLYALAALVATAAVAVISHVATKKYYVVKAKASVVSELFQEGVQALEDDVLTVEELQKIEKLIGKLVE